MAQFTLTISMEDFEGDGTSVSGVVADASADPTALIAAMKGVQSGTPAYIGASIAQTTDVAITTNVVSGDGECDRSKSWAVRCKDSVTGRVFTKYVSCADFTLAANGVLDHTTGVGKALADAMIALYLSPAGNAFTVNKIYKARR